MKENLAEFFRQASFYRYHEKFDEFERLYKICLANSFRDVHQVLDSNPTQAINLFRRALTSKDDNIINWRDQDPILKFSKTNPTSLLRSLKALWGQERELEDRFSSFCETLRQINVTQTGGQLAVTSTLLMALSPWEYPPVKTEPFIRARSWQVGPFLNESKPPFRDMSGHLLLLMILLKPRISLGLNCATGLMRKPLFGAFLEVGPDCRCH